VAGPILQPMPPAVQTVCGGLMFSVNFVLVPSNLLHLVPSFLTLWLEPDNGRPAGLMKGESLLFFTAAALVVWLEHDNYITCCTCHL